MQDTLPFVQVARLPPSASFYSAVTQPLGLRFISASPTNIIFGTPYSPVFEVRAANVGPSPHKRARIVFSAPSRDAVADFYAAALRAYPDLQKGGDSFLHRQDPYSSGQGHDNGKASVDRARIRDLDGNIMEVVYVNPPGYASNYGGQTVRRTQSTDEEAGRILDWNFDVATSAVGSTVESGPIATPTYSRRMSHQEYPDLESPRILRRSVTTSTIEHSAPQHQLQTQQQATASGMSTGAVVGSVLGAVAVGTAIGGALTYTLMKKERDRAPRQEYALYPDGNPNGANGGQQRPRYVEVERTVEKVRYPQEEYHPPPQQQQQQQPGGNMNGNMNGARKYPPPAPSQMDSRRYAQPGGPGGVAMSRALEDVDDRASRAPSRYTTGTRARGRSEAGSTRRPLMIDEAEYRSAAGSKYTSGPKLLMDTEHRSNAGSRYTALPIRLPTEAPSPVPVAADYRSQADYKSQADYRSQAGSRFTAAAPAPPPPPPAPPLSSAPSALRRRATSNATEAEYRSRAPSRAPSAAPSRTPSRHRSVAAPETYVSARSQTQRSEATTVKPMPARAETAAPSVVTPSRAPSMSRTGGGSRYAASAVRGPGATPRSTAPSHVGAAREAMAAAREAAAAAAAPAPSQVSTATNRSRMYWDDDAGSLAPDDSISNVGGRRYR